MAKKSSKVKRQRIRVSRRDWDEAQRLTDAVLSSESFRKAVDPPKKLYGQPETVELPEFKE